MSGRHPEVDEFRQRWLRSRGPRPAVASLVLIGLVLGIITGLTYAWIISPVVYTQASPARLDESYKAEYILLISQSYAMDQDWERAQVRLAALADPDINLRVLTQLETYLREGQPAAVMRDLAALAAQMGINSPAVALFLPASAAMPPATRLQPGETPVVAGLTPESPETTSPTETPRPTSTTTIPPTPTTVPVYRLLSQEQLCLEDESAPRIEVIAVDSLLEPLPGAEVVVQWADGSDNFFTGYKPEKGMGYADFEMSPAVGYTVVMAEGSQRVDGLAIFACPAESGGLAGGWRLTFQNTDVRQETPTPTRFAQG